MKKLEKILEEMRESSIMVATSKEHYIHPQDRRFVEEVVLLDDVEKIIRKHMNDGWIPAEERLPEYGEPVLVRWKKGGILDHSVAQYFGMSWIRDREDFIFITMHGIPHNQGWEPIAWCPLPEQYRPERSEEE